MKRSEMTSHRSFAAWQRYDVNFIRKPMEKKNERDFIIYHDGFVIARFQMLLSVKIKGKERCIST